MYFPMRRCAFAALLLAASSLAAQQTPQPQQPGITLSLADAVRLAENESEAVRIARTGGVRAEGQFLQARSGLFPQITGSASYQRALQLQFEEISKRLGSGGGSDTSSDGGGNAFADSPLARVFASPNTIVLGVNGAQTLYAGGRVRAGISAADAGRRSADFGLRAARAQLIYDVAEAYFNAQVASQLLIIAESAFVQTERTFAQTQLAREVGNTAEFDLIRARVQRDNARPAVIGARTQRDVAFLRLRQVLNLPLDRPLSLTTAIDTTPSAPVVLRGANELVLATPDTATASRTVVRQMEEAVRAQEQQLKVVRGQRLPSVQLSSTYQRFAYPAKGTVFEESIKYYFPNWTVSLGVSMPFFTGGRQRGEQLVAEANLADARDRYQQTREGAALDTRIALAQLEQAEAAFAASAGTDEQAARAYSIAEVRFSEGVSTQLELTQARIDLETARANRVQAARDVALARLKVALLRDLPITGAANPGAPQ
jgi:outer membrane protein